MLQRQSKNNDLVIQVEGAGIRKLEYYTDGEYKYVTDYVSETVYIPSSELKKMNDGQLNSTIYIGVDNDNFSDGTQDRVVNQTFSIWIGEENSDPNPSSYYTKDQINEILSQFVTEIPSEYITEDELNSRGYLTNVPEEYITEQELNDRGYLTQHQDISNLATKTELNGKQDKGDYALKTDIPVVPTKVSAFENDAGYALKSNSEEITFTLEDGSTITKKFVLG